MTTSAGVRYCEFIWAATLVVFLLDVAVVTVVLQKVKTVWIRVAVFMAGVSLILALPIMILFLGCGTV